MAEKTIWGIHAGSEGEADSLFIKNKVIAIGWHRVGKLIKYKDREMYKNVLQKKHDGTGWYAHTGRTNCSRLYQQRSSVGIRWTSYWFTTISDNWWT